MCGRLFWLRPEKVPVQLPPGLSSVENGDLMSFYLEVADVRELSIADARNRLSALVHEVERGHPVCLTRRGRPVAVLLSLREYERLGARWPDLWEAIESFRRQTDLCQLEVDEIFAGVRDVPPDAR